MSRPKRFGLSQNGLDPEGGIPDSRGQSELSQHGPDPEAKTSKFQIYQKFSIRDQTLLKLSRTFRKLTEIAEGYHSTIHTQELCNLLKFSVLYSPLIKVSFVCETRSQVPQVSG